MADVDRSHILLPFVNQVLQLSPQLNKKNDKFIEGVKSGQFVNSVTNALLPDELHFVPCAIDHNYVEWTPRDNGGGFVAVHDVQSDVVKKAREASKGGLDLKTPAGNDLQETFYIYGIRTSGPGTGAEEAVVLSFSKTKIKSYKTITTRLFTWKGTKQVPLFAYQLVMKSFDTQNKKGQPYSNVTIEPAVENDIQKSLLPPLIDGKPNPLLLAGKELYEGFKGSLVRADHASQEAAPPAAEGGTDKIF